MKEEKTHSLTTPTQKPSTKTPQSNLEPLSAVLVTVIVYILSQVAAAIVIGLYALAKGLDGDQISALLTESTIAQFIYFLSAGSFVIILLWQFLKLRKIKWSEIGLTKPTSDNLIMAIPVFAAYFVTLLLVVGLVTQLIPAIDTEQEQQIGFGGAAGKLALSMVFISLVIVPAISEEILIRGFLYGGLVKKFSKITAALMASLLFGFAHLQLGLGADPLWVAAIDTFILSMFLIWLREKTGNIYAGMLVHAAKNTIAFAALFIFNVNV